MSVLVLLLIVLAGCKYTVTVHDPEKVWPGYVLPSRSLGSTTSAMDLQGNIVKTFPCPGFPAKMLDDGSIICNNLKFGRLIVPEIRQVSRDGDVLWQFRGWSNNSAKQHHDYQVTGNPVGYYVPGMTMVGPADGGNVLIMANKTLAPWEQDIHYGFLKDDVIYEVDPFGNVVWEWYASDHIDEMGFTESALRSIRRSLSNDWLHMNTVSYVGPNQWYEDLGDERFHPENLIVGSAKANWVAIIEKSTGRLVWRMGPDYSEGMPGANLGGIRFSHNAHIIPKGLPGEGNILVFDNGMPSGRGDLALKGKFKSRVLEFNPINFSLVWEYTDTRLFSPNMSSAQRLPNGNTFITEGLSGTLLEVTADKELVWEAHGPPTYRAYRIPFQWVDSPQE
ncbi:aryl-sulfate sulfotransferase [Ketobacter sp.]|uniref:aryl-sulfate sulfotransferase n=1 Tax=Ketobacter sp. TaxID=2083498 RepID=UPI000F0EA790|nr:aryl-sulfate sulfotransferase [Ketobacter sp.]RLU00333.1 MAG: thioredoxin [Ketobacter sp.]